MLCRRTCPSGEWRAGPIWRRWVMHLSWTTSREQHLLAQTPHARCVSHTEITWPSQELQDQSAGSGYLTWNICFKSIQEKHFWSLLAFHLRRLCFLRFFLLTTALHWKQRCEIPRKDKTSRQCSVQHTNIRHSSMPFVCRMCTSACTDVSVSPRRAVCTREYCVWYGIPWCKALDLTFHFCPSTCFFV